MSTVLHNSGKRVIQCQNGGVHFDFKPGQSVEFTDDKEAARLQGLFVGELTSRADVLQPFAKAEDNAKADAEAAEKAKDAGPTEAEKEAADLKARKDAAFQDAKKEGFSDAEAKELSDAVK